MCKRGAKASATQGLDIVPAGDGAFEKSERTWQGCHGSIGRRTQMNETPKTAGQVESESSARCQRSYQKRRSLQCHRPVSNSYNNRNIVSRAPAAYLRLRDCRPANTFTGSACNSPCRYGAFDSRHLHYFSDVFATSCGSTVAAL